MNYYTPTYNPNYVPMQQRLNQMEQQYPQFAPCNTNTSNIQSCSVLKGRPVTGIDEAKAAPIDFDGSVHIFPDIANKRIYTKQLGMDGLPVFSIYELIPVSEIDKTNDVTYVPFIDFEQLKEKVEAIEQAVSKSKNDKQSGGK